MATLDKTKISLTLVILSLVQYAFVARAQDSDTRDPKALNAYKQYWDAFADYEFKKRKSAVEEFERARDGLALMYENKDRALQEKRIDLLSSGISRYEHNLTTIPNASNRAYVMLNLAQMVAELGSLQESLDTARASASRQKSLTILKELADKFPDFEYRNDAYYLRASLLEANNQTDAALAIWRTLAKSTVEDRYALHANLAAGDWEFDHASPEKALAYYERAQGILGKIDQEEKSVDELRIQYRTAWAAYKATKHDRAMTAAEWLLGPGNSSRVVRQREQIARDASDIIGMSLFELNDLTKTKRFLSRKEISAYSGAISKLIIEKYLAASQYDSALNLAQFTSDKFGSTAELPDILRSGIRAAQGLNRPATRIEYTEKLAMLLPDQSMWRVLHGNDSKLIKHMEEQAKAAAIAAAAWHYENGTATMTPRSFNLAAGFYQILISDNPSAPEASEWRLRRAHCSQFAGKLGEAEQQYNELISNLKVNSEILSLAMYNKALTLEKLWRQKFELAVQKGIEPTKDQDCLDVLKRLESSVEDHANRFPGQSRSTDLLLVVASANRDHNRFNDASRFWQRSLLGAPTESQRATAIRGLVFAELRSGKSADVITGVNKFLKLENKATLSQSLATELKGVLSSATMEQGQKLAKAGQNEEAGELLVSVAQEFTDIPNREQILRDGAYMMAIGGAWPSAEKVAGKYLGDGLRKYAGDMQYLLARSHEFQLRFTAAVDSYLELAKKYPKHSRVTLALERAEKLAVADENYTAAAEAQSLSANRAKPMDDRLAALTKSANYYMQSNQLERALKIAEQRKTESKADHEKLESDLLIARINYMRGDKQSALDDLDSITKQVERARFKLGDRYPRLLATGLEFIADDTMERFRELRLADKQDTNAAAAQKAEIFQRIVTQNDKIAQLDLGEQSARARFQLATAATEFSDELSGLPLRSGEPMTMKSQTRFNQNITRMRELAKQYHSNNILAKQRDPQKYARSEWVRKSGLALSLTGEESTREVKDQVRAATYSEVPQQWSY